MKQQEEQDGTGRDNKQQGQLKYGEMDIPECEARGPQVSWSPAASRFHHLDPIQNCPDQCGDTRCGLFVVMGDALQYHLICPVNQLSHRAVETSETGGDCHTAERTGRSQSMGH